MQNTNSTTVEWNVISNLRCNCKYVVGMNYTFCFSLCIQMNTINTSCM